jgi:CRP-like cAMP-binding protein
VDVDSRASFNAALPEEEADGILTNARRRRFQRGDIVFHEGDPGDKLHVVNEGRFPVQTGTAEGERVTLRIVTAGEVFGELSIFLEHAPRSATVMTLESGRTTPRARLRRGLAIDRPMGAASAAPISHATLANQPRPA